VRQELRQERELLPGTVKITDAVAAQAGRPLPSAADRRRQFMEHHEVHGVKLAGGRGDWLRAVDVLRIARRLPSGKPSLGEARARKLVQAIGNQKKTAGGRMMYVAAFDQVMKALQQSDLLDEESLSWWVNYSSSGQQMAVTPPV
jgi:hypothetical protein